jgi:hypothetical protein
MFHSITKVSIMEDERRLDKGQKMAERELPWNPRHLSTPRRPFFPHLVGMTGDCHFDWKKEAAGGNVEICEKRPKFTEHSMEVLKGDCSAILIC